MTCGKQKINSPRRLFKKEGTLTLQLTKGSRGHAFKFWLFNDILVYATEKNSQHFDFKEAIPLYVIIVRSLNVNSKTTPSSPTINKNSNIDCMFQIRRTDDKKTYTLTSKSEYERDEWVKVLMGLVNEWTAKQDHTSRVTKQLYMQNWDQS